MIIQLCLGLIILGLVACFGSWGIFRVQHKFWSTVPGPHFYHHIGTEIGLCKSGIIRKDAAQHPPYHPQLNEPSPLDQARISEYVEFFNQNYNISSDYKHIFTANALIERLFAPGVIGLHLIDEDAKVIGVIASCPLHAKFATVAAVGMIDYLCVDVSVRGVGLANYMISWMDRTTSLVGRRVHFFEREMQPAPIPAIQQTIYMYCECSGNGIEIRNKEAIDAVVSEYTVIDANIYRRSDIWADKTATGAWIVQNAYMTSSSGSFGIVLGIVGNPMAEMRQLSPWKYLISPQEYAKLDASGVWKYSSTGWTHIYNYIPEKSQLLKILY